MRGPVKGSDAESGARSHRIRGTAIAHCCYATGMTPACARSAAPTLSARVGGVLGLELRDQRLDPGNDIDEQRAGPVFFGHLLKRGRRIGEVQSRGDQAL